MPKKEKMILHTLPDVAELSYPIGSHMDEVIEFINKLKPIIANICKDLLDTTPNITIAIWCRGSSGAILASLLSVILYSNNIHNVCIKHVKKPNEPSHGTNYCSFANYNIIIDDFSCTGNTINQIIHKMYDYGIEYIDCLILSDVGLSNYRLPFTVPKMLITGNSKNNKLLKKLEPEEIRL